jgi:hypothetical protein
MPKIRLFKTKERRVKWAAAYEKRQAMEQVSVMKNIIAAMLDRTMTRELYYRLFHYLREKEFVDDMAPGWSYLDRWRYKIDFVKFFKLGDFIYISVKDKVA